jgi:hypothetical protein
MVLNISETFVKKYLLFFFKYFFKYGFIPLTLNISHIVPISLSNPFAELFERIILLKVPEINNTNENQWGYKNKIPCSHALFAYLILGCMHIFTKT